MQVQGSSRLKGLAHVTLHVSKGVHVACKTSRCMCCSNIVYFSIPSDTFTDLTHRWVPLYLSSSSSSSMYRNNALVQNG